MSFERKLEKPAIANLTSSSLWMFHLESDCKNQNIFLAVRNNSIGIYHKGGKLFNFEKNEFKTHIKYASVIDNSEIAYLTENELSKNKLITDFKNNYSRIKENCGLYSGIEALGVSEVYHKYSYLSRNNIVVLDIEISFEALEKTNGEKQDRIDILLYDLNTRTLKFVEAKHYSNPEIWSNGTPKVIGQIKKYETQIKTNKTEIIAAYKNYMEAINSVFDLELPLPEKVEEKVALLIFGFDNDQKNGRLQKLILSNPVFKGFQVYCKQDKINPSSLWSSKIL
ncbi:hypothetical protein [Macellibacteroides fermentans]|uniref:hypothetical protein n=1 Tax=Macellibacteroides fermentans TaxID=879969 RepID=UPI00352FE6A5